jgi:hypothetical protein
MTSTGALLVLLALLATLVWWLSTRPPATAGPVVPAGAQVAAAGPVVAPAETGTSATTWASWASWVSVVSLALAGAGVIALWLFERRNAAAKTRALAARAEARAARFRNAFEVVLTAAEFANEGLKKILGEESNSRYKIATEEAEASKAKNSRKATTAETKEMEQFEEDGKALTKRYDAQQEMGELIAQAREALNKATDKKQVEDASRVFLAGHEKLKPFLREV